MTHIVTMPDGSTHAFPDEATPEMMAEALGVSTQSPADKVMSTEKHIFGIPARTIAEGATALPLAIASIPAATANTEAWLYNKATGGNAQYLPLPVSQYSEQLTKMGLPEPETGLERIGSDVGKAVLGAGSGIGMADEAIANGSTSSFARAMAENPSIQYQAATGGAVGSGGARELGAPPWAQTTMGVLGSLMAPGGAEVLKAIHTGTQPLYQAGRNQIMADLMASKANDPVAAANAIQNAPQYVPGSVPVAGAASGDTGLMGLQRGVENLPTSEQLFKDRAIQQTAAQNDLLSNVAGNPADMAQLQQARTMATKPFYESATNAPYNPKMLQPVLDNIDSEISKVGTTTQAGKMLSDMKANIMAESQDPGKMGPLIQMYKENRDNFAKKMLQDGAVTPAVKGVVNPANKMLGDVLTRNNEDVAYADATFKNMSKPINQLEAGQAIKAQIQANSPNAAGQLPIKQPSLQSLMESGVVNVDGNEIPLTQLTDTQQKGLSSLQSDLNRNIAATGSRVSPTPASELTNLAAQTRLTKLASHIPIVKGVVTSKNIQIQEQLAKALLDNPETARLLLMGRDKQPQRLAQILMQLGGGGGLGTISSVPYGGHP